MTDYGKGIIGILSGELGRYRAFDIALMDVERPAGTLITYGVGLNLAQNSNNIIRYAVNKELDWVWLLDDDHVFPRDLLIKLLERNVEFVMPLAVQRKEPFNPVLHKPMSEGGKRSGYENLHGKSGLIDIGDWSTGKGCALIRTSVFKKIPPPWFTLGQIDPELTSPDTHFCQKMHAAGIPIYVDLDNVTGHIAQFAVWPDKDANNHWGYRIQTVY